MRYAALFVLGVALVTATNAVASAPTRTSDSGIATQLLAPGDLCSFGVRSESSWSNDRTTFADGSWVVHAVENVTLTNQATGGLITGHLTYNVMFDPAENAGKTKGLLFQARDARGNVVSTTAGLIAQAEGSIAKVTPNAVLLAMPNELICTPLANAAP